MESGKWWKVGEARVRLRRFMLPASTIHIARFGDSYHRSAQRQLGAAFAKVGDAGGETASRRLRLTRQTSTIHIVEVGDVRLEATRPMI